MAVAAHGAYNTDQSNLCPIFKGDQKFMAEEFFGDRKRALEESFFLQQDQKLLERLRAELQDAQQKDALVNAAGIRDEALLSSLLNLGLDAQTVAALTLAPLVEVAWAHGGIVREERMAVLQAAESHGVGPGTAAHELLEKWMNEKPGPELFSAWYDYVSTLRKTMDPKSFEKLRDNILDRAEQVAQAAGGFLGIVSISGKEKAVLSKLEKAFKA